MNPWTGVDSFRELLYDCRHPVLFGRRALTGLRQGRFTPAQAVVGIGCLNILLGTVLILFGRS